MQSKLCRGNVNQMNTHFFVVPSMLCNGESKNVEVKCFVRVCVCLSKLNLRKGGDLIVFKVDLLGPILQDVK